MLAKTFSSWGKLKHLDSDRCCRVGRLKAGFGGRSGMKLWKFLEKLQGGGRLRASMAFGVNGEHGSLQQLSGPPAVRKLVLSPLSNKPPKKRIPYTCSQQLRLVNSVGIKERRSQLDKLSGV